MIFLNDQLFGQLGAVADEAFFTYDLRASRFDYVSPAFARIFTLSVTSEILPAQLLALVHPDDHDYLQHQASVFRESGRLTAEFRLMATGEERFVQLTAYVLDDGHLVAGWLTDTHNAKQNILYAEKINARKNSMLELLSHDLKEPVAIINMMAAALAQSPEISKNISLQQYINVIRELCETNIHLIRSLVEKEFLLANEVGLRLERADLVSAVSDIMDTYAASSAVVKKQFIFESAGASLYLLMDTLKIIQVVDQIHR